MKQDLSKSAAQTDAAGTSPSSAPLVTKTRRPRRMARESGEQGPAEQAAPPVRGSSKIEQVLALLRRGEGATLAEMVEATGWLPHTTRAALTGLRKKGHVLAKDKRGDVTCYRLAETGQ